jgi:hypothetical protein
MASGRPDYTALTLMMGNNAGTLRNVGVDAAGNILTLIKGQFGGAPVTIAVDAGGNILGILKGDYAGSLKTLAVDAQGRMLAVLTDPEDVFGNPHYMGSAELAARLGSPDCLERSGQVVFMDSGGISVGQYNVTAVGAASAMVADTTYGLMGPASYKLTAGPAENDYIRAVKHCPSLSLDGIGIEAVLAISPDAKYVTLAISVSTTTTIHTGYIRINRDTDKIEYRDSTGAYVELADMPSALLLTDVHFWKLCINPVLGTYLHFRWDAQLYDLSALPLYSYAAAGTQQLSGLIEVKCHAAGTVTAYAGPLIITVKET